MEGFRSWPYDEKPLLVFWESTRACQLACIHCRAEAILNPLPGELSNGEALRLIDEIVSFSEPRPILIITGGDPLMRRDIWDLLSYAASLRLKTSLAPSVTPLLNDKSIKMISDIGVSAVSISIDSAHPEVHDKIRGVKGVWSRSVEVIKKFRDYGVKVQVNTVVMRPTLNSLPDMVALLRKFEVPVWEVFYLVRVGRAQEKLDLTPEEWEAVSHFLYEASKYDVTVRTVEGPMFRRVAMVRRFLESMNVDPDVILKPGSLYEGLLNRLKTLLGPPTSKPKAYTVGTRDGKGIVFIAYNGDVYPSGFLPVKAGNIRERSLRDIYTRSSLFLALRRGEFKGKCGACKFKEICGGSRARAYSIYGDPLAEDPACPYEPNYYESIGLNMKVISS
ncbi:MAG: TIGR04053 family radical SAM/SPASM domain-containing protein [Thermoprotei archaeon]|nr:TIGR04053 family radical SAM/SPASM domain-containing protein [Thermoprotei archaeon]